jgi:hypothetical protein
MTEITGPVQLLAVGFRDTADFRGRIAEEIDRLERSDTIRVLDFVFLHRDATTGGLVRMDFEGPEGEGRVTMLLADGSSDSESESVAGGAFRLTSGDIREAAAALEPGTSAGFLIFEHLWARELKRAIVETDGVPFAEGFLTPEAVAAIGG